MALRPLEDKIVVKVVKEEEKTTSSGLVLAGMAEEKPSEAIVIAVGPGMILQDGSKIEADVKVGDKVIFSKYGGTEISHDGEDYLILAIRDIFAVVE